MSNETFSNTIAGILRNKDWYAVFPPEAELSRIRISASGSKKPPVDYTLVNTFEQYRGEINAIFENQGRKQEVESLEVLRRWAEASAEEHYHETQSPFRWPGVLDIVNVLQQPRLHISRLYKEIHRFRREIVKIDEGLLQYGKYSKSDRIRGLPEADYCSAIRRFLASVKRSIPTVDLRGLDHELRYRGSRQLSIEKRADREDIQKFVLKLLKWVKGTRRKGRPPDDGSILLYHLVNSLTRWQRKKDGKPRKDRHGRFKVDRCWDDVARVLIWLHYNRIKIPWLAIFIKNHASKDARRAIIELKKLVQSRYSHLNNHADPGQTYEGAFSPIGILRVVSFEDHLSAIYL
jgi:hypothetical protein